MSGICGIIPKRGKVIIKEELDAMLAPLVKRGPDHEGKLLEKQFAFGHRRLNIIDPSLKAHQPMDDRQHGLAVTYDGAIYNYKELQKELSDRGYTFESESDTEVLLKAYHCWGDSFIEKLNGAFAFCIYDRNKEVFIFGRDRLGIKPIYYTLNNGDLYFASTIQALNQAGKVDGALSREALHYYLSFHAVVPAPFTIYEGVKKFEPGTLQVMDRNGGFKKHKYWSVTYKEEKDISEEQAAGEILHTLRESVRQQMFAGHVPVGALLSGGVDSSLIVAFMAEFSTSAVKTYSVGFENAGGEEGNEFYYSDLVSREFDTEHHKFFVESGKLLNEAQNCLRAMTEPMVSHDAVAFYLLAREVSKETRVVLCGQGADEIFAGYHWYPKMMEEKEDPVSRYRKSFFDREHAEVLETLQQEYRPLQDYSSQFVENHFGQTGATSAVNKALRIDSTIMAVDDPIKRVDNMTMHWGLEARFPFLQHQLVELAARIPISLKVKNGGKYILKKAAEKILPHAVIYRKKGYFPVPAIKYMQGEFLDFAGDVLFSRKARQRGLYNPDYIDKLWARPAEQMTVLGVNKLWQLAALEYWLQEMEG